MDDFSSHPTSLGEVRSERSERASDWTPRDALISVLRDIDAGAIAPDALIISYRLPTPDGIGSTSFVMASPDPLVCLGLLARSAFRIQMSGEK
ncbi:MAG: hypothetical protein ACRCYS_04950 [Beijerinckiaceae bacterium]